jgi:hypothetical protein
MFNENEIDLTEEERIALSGLSREMQVGDLLEQRTVIALRDAGHFGSKPKKSSSLPMVLRIAAAIALFAGGVATGRYLVAGETRERASTESPQSTITEPKTAAPRIESRPASGRETVVAEREMWM